MGICKINKNHLNTLERETHSTESNKLNSKKNTGKCSITANNTALLFPFNKLIKLSAHRILCVFQNVYIQMKRVVCHLYFFICHFRAASY